MGVLRDERKCCGTGDCGGTHQAVRGKMNHTGRRLAQVLALHEGCGVRCAGARRTATKSAARRRRVGNEKKRRSVYEEVNGKKERKKLTSECLFVCLCAKELFATKKKAFN